MILKERDVGCFGVCMKEPQIDPQLILSHIRDGLLIVDTEGKVIWANQVFKEMIGSGDHDLAGKTCCELAVGPFCDDLCPARCSNGGEGCAQTAHFNVQITGNDKAQPGTYCFVSSPLFDHNGRLLGHMENFRDMNQVRDVIMQLEEVNQAINAEREKTEQLIDSLADGVFSVDEQLRIRRFSRNLEKMLGISAEEACGRHCCEVLRGSLCESDCPLAWARDNQSPVTDSREELITRDGRSIPVAVSIGLLRNEPEFERGLFGVVTNRSEVEELRRELQEGSVFHGIIGRSSVMRALADQIRAVAPTEATVLITGESGTGKELVARAIHRESRRASGPFTSVNCAALVEELLESELFGHLRGAFTGAVRDRKGRFDQAAGGTLFLDEVGDTSPALQAKLLRAVQEKTIEPVGSGKAHKVDVRIVTATNKDLTEEVRAGRFREDLYYRLNVIPIHLPLLRQRRSDIPLLVDHFMKKYRKLHRRDTGAEGISERALAVMMEYDWPGNVRELEHAVEYALISSTTGRIERAFLPQPLRRLTPEKTNDIEDEVSRSQEPVTARDRKTIISSLEQHRWNVSQTAESLGVSRTTLWRRMKRLGIER
jgi:PAS domain S-box-containing protein